MSWMILAFVFWIFAWGTNIALVRSRLSDTTAVKYTVPILFGLTIVVLWEAAVHSFAISPAILPAPSAVADRFVNSTGMLWEDFVQTVLKGALRGYIFGVLAAFVVAILIDRSPFLTRGLLPIGNFVAALPIVGVAPFWSAGSALTGTRKRL